MARKSSERSREQTELLEARTSTAPAVPAVRRAVDEWRLAGYQGISDTTRSLLTWWFPKDGHRRKGGRTFRYHPFQRDAVETLIYLYEVAEIRTQKNLLERFVN